MNLLLEPLVLEARRLYLSKSIDFGKYYDIMETLDLLWYAKKLGFYDPDQFAQR